MLVFTTHTEIHSFLSDKKKSVGLVPTMGALHKGHISLVEIVAQENEWVIVSIFINPTQFNNPEDLANYPKNLVQDKIALSAYDEKLILYVPEPEDLYPEKLESKEYHFNGLEKHMEGAFRPGHFNGVATVVEALFKKLIPNRAYFGEKDYQQLQIIKALNKQLDLKIKIVECPIIREKDGLAMSSRNTLLNPEQREAAPVIFKSLKEIKFHQTQWSVSEMEAFFQASIERESQLKLDYFYVAKTSDLIPTYNLEAGMTYRIFVAVFAGKTRLIDTVELEKKNTFTPC